MLCRTAEPYWPKLLGSAYSRKQVQAFCWIYLAWRVSTGPNTAPHVQVDLRLRRMRDPGFTPSVPIPDMRTSAGGLAVTMGAFTNVRFQIVGGIDRYLFDHSNYLVSYLALSTAFRAASTWIGQPTRLHLQARARSTLAGVG